MPVLPLVFGRSHVLDSVAIFVDLMQERSQKIPALRRVEHARGLEATEHRGESSCVTDTDALATMSLQNQTVH